jgi:putative DNA primase/helicase
VSTIHDAAEWAHIQPLRGIAQWPVLAPNGEIVINNGYSPSTRYLLSSVPRIELPPKPTHEHAAAALARLLGLIAEFPFVSAEGRAAWVSGILTVLARPAIDGPVPAIIFDAPTPGAGKTLLAHAISLLVTGDMATARAAPDDNGEWNRAILSIALGGDPVVLFDNLRGKLENGTLEAVLTSQRYADRKLRTNEDVRVDVQSLFLITGNNMTVTRDFVRRALHCRLVPDVERPEQRGDYQIRDLAGHIRAHRAELLSAALTIFWAYSVAGSPVVSMRHLGTYEKWSEVVRRPLIWAGGGDPALTQDALLENAVAEETGGSSALLEAWFARYGETPRTGRDVLADHAVAGDLELRLAIEGVCAGKVTPRALGAHLSTLRDCVLGSHRLAKVKHTKAGDLWRVVRVDALAEG